VFRFLHAVADAADELARRVHHYSDPENVIVYGAEIDALRRASAAVAQTPYDPESGALASTRCFGHGTTMFRLSQERASAKHGEMMKLVSLLQAELDADDAPAF
jgi:hypothetical protein